MLTRYLMNGCTIHGLIAAAAAATAALMLRFNRSKCHRHASFGLIDIGVCIRYVQYISFHFFKSKQATTMEKMNFASYLKEDFFSALTCYEHENQKCLMHLIWLVCSFEGKKHEIFGFSDLFQSFVSFVLSIICWSNGTIFIIQRRI